MPIVEVNGQEYEFPDSMGKDEIRSILNRKFGNEPSTLTSATSQIEQGMTMGAADELKAALGAGLLKAATSLYPSETPYDKYSVGELYDIGINKEQERLAAEREKLGTGSTIAANLAGGILTGKGIGQGLSAVAPKTFGFLSAPSSSWIGARGKDVASGILYGVPTGYFSAAPNERAEGALIGGAGGALLAPIAGTAVSALTKPTAQTSSAAPQARKAISEMIDEPFKQELAETSYLPSPIRMSRGDITQDFRAQDIEEQLLKGVLGAKGQAQMADFRTGQKQDFLKNIESLYSGKAPIENQYLGEALGSQLSGAAQAAQSAKTAAYKQAGEAGSKALLPKEVGLDLSKAVKSIVQDYDPATVKASGSILKYANDLEKLVSNPSVTGLKYNALEGFRKRLNGIGANTAADNAVIGKAKGAFDALMDDVMQKGLLQGDDNAIALIKDARAKNTYYMKKFAGDDANKVIRGYIDSKGGLTEVAPEELMKQVIRVGQTGLNNVKAAKDVLGDKAKPVLQDGFLNMIRQKTIYTDANGETLINPTALSKEIDNFISKNPTLANEVFDKPTLLALKELSAIGRKTGKQAGIVNTSNTGNLFIRFMQGNNFLGRLLSKVPMGGMIQEGFTNMRGAGLAQQAVQNPAYPTLVGQYQRISGATP